ncbi:MAG: LytR/AlgR family response regulator transcription factor, partial [Coprobacter sp.]
IGDRCRIIFTTAFEQYAVDSYRVNALDYLLKPIAYPDFLNACEKACQWYELTDNTARKKEELKSIFIKTDYKLVQIELDKILYVEGLKDYVKIYVENEPHPILSLMSLKSLEDVLPSDRFIRVHRSFIVQADKIKVIERNRIVFGKQYIPISDSYKSNFQAMINQRSITGKS